MKSARLTFPFLVQDYFTRYLPIERGMSPRSITTYRDGIKLFLIFSQKKLKKNPTDIEFSDLNVDLVLDFLDNLENDRNNLVRSRNQRLAVVRSFVRYISYKSPEFLGDAQRILSIPRKRSDTPMLEYLTREEIEAIIKSADRSTQAGERDFMLFTLMYNTGARVSEVLSLKKINVNFHKPASVSIDGKGRKERKVPLWSSTTNMLQAWCTNLNDNSPLFKNRDGNILTRSGVAFRLEGLVKKATIKCPSMIKKNISPHTIRHTTAMHLLQAGIDITMIAMWLGHSSLKSTHGYVEASIEMKAAALDKLQDPKFKGKKFKPDDAVLAILQQL
jgi:integrase/recombinase XerD